MISLLFDTLEGCGKSFTESYGERQIFY